MCSLELLSLARSSNATRKSSERNDPLVVFNVGEIRISFRQFHAYRKISIELRIINALSKSHQKEQPPLRACS